MINPNAPMKNRTVFVLSSLVVISIIFLTIFSVAQVQIPILKAPELSSPSDWINEKQIKVYDNKVVIDLLSPIWAKFTDTNSMDPFIDENSHAIEVLPSDLNSINAGDVISYQEGSNIFIHRVISKGTDNEGIYFVVKGDNISLRDFLKIRSNQVRGVVVAVIY